jgi:hypothetical protein
MALTRRHPVDVTGPGNVALEIEELWHQGGSMPKIIRDFLRRTTDPTKGPLTYQEARGFYQNATRLSVDEFNRLNPNAQRLIGRFTHELGQAVSQTTARAGTLEKYQSFMREFHRAAQNQRRVAAIKKYATKTLPYGAAGAGAAYAFEKIVKGK